MGILAPISKGYLPLMLVGLDGPVPFSNSIKCATTVPYEETHSKCKELVPFILYVFRANKFHIPMQSLSLLRANTGRTPERQADVALGQI